MNLSVHRKKDEKAVVHSHDVMKKCVFRGEVVWGWGRGVDQKVTGCAYTERRGMVQAQQNIYDNALLKPGLSSWAARV